MLFNLRELTYSFFSSYHMESLQKKKKMSNNNNSDSDSISTTTSGDGRGRPFPSPYLKANRNFQRLIKRLEKMEDFRYNCCPAVAVFLERYPVYKQYDCLSFQSAYDAVQEIFDRSE